MLFASLSGFSKKAFNLETPANGEDAAYFASWRRPALEAATLAVCGFVASLPYSQPALAPLSWLALAPLYLIARGGSALRAGALAFVWGYFLSFGGFWWLREIEVGVPFAMSAILALFPTVWALTIPVLERNLLLPKEIRLRGFEAVSEFRSKSVFGELLLPLSLASLWCLLEWLRTWIFTGFPWNFLSSAQWKFTSFIQIAEFTGVYGLSFVMALVGISLGMLVAPWTRRRPAAPLLAASLFVLSLLCGLLLYKRAAAAESDADLKAAMIQCEISQRRHAKFGEAEEALNICAELSENAFVSLSKKGIKPDVMIWPETAVPVPFGESAWALSVAYRYRVFDMIRYWETPFLLGSLDYGDASGPEGRRPAYNAALLIDTTPKIADSYRKEHIVPFGEFVPYGDVFPQLNKWIGMGRNLSRGTRFNPLELKKGVYAGISICYEDVFPYISRAHARNGANMLLVVTNDAWYPKSSEPYQHFANSIFRAVETRLPMLRCGNANYSVLISPTGEVIDSASKTPDGKPEPGLSQRTFAFMDVKLQTKPRQSFHTVYGNVFVLLCAFVAGFGLLLSALNWRDLKSSLLGAFEEKPPLD